MNTLLDVIERGVDLIYFFYSLIYKLYLVSLFYISYLYLPHIFVKSVIQVYGSLWRNKISL